MESGEAEVIEEEGDVDELREHEMNSTGCVRFCERMSNEISVE